MNHPTGYFILRSTYLNTRNVEVICNCLKDIITNPLSRAASEEKSSIDIVSVKRFKRRINNTSSEGHGCRVRSCRSEGNLKGQSVLHRCLNLCSRGKVAFKILA